MSEHPVESPLMKLLMHKAVLAGQPAAGTFELSPVCNFSCRMCYVRKSSKEVAESDRPIMELNDWLLLADECQKLGMLSLLLTGGEPFLWPDFWTLYEELHRKGFLVSINTNGSLINEDAIQQLKKYPPARINITLYGASDDTYYDLCQRRGQFQRVVENIRALKKAGISVKLNCSLTPQNAHDLEKMVHFSEEEKLVLSVTPYMFPPLRRDANAVGQNERFTPKEAAYYNLERFRLQHSDADYQRFLRDLQNKTSLPSGLLPDCGDEADGTVRCRAGRASFWVTWDGWLTSCGMMPEPKIDLRNLDFATAWQSIKEETANLHLASACSSCSNHDLCNACAAMAYTETGRTERIPVYLCQMVEEMRRLAEQTSLN